MFFISTNKIRSTMHIQLTWIFIIACLVLVTSTWADFAITEKNSPFDLRGTLKQNFAMSIVLMDPSANLVCSPTSVYLLLGKLALGADRPTIGELEIAIGIYNKEELKVSYKSLIHNLRNVPGAVTINIASRLFVDTNTVLKTRYCQEAREVFGTCLERVDFSRGRETADVINNWVSKETNSKIPRIVSANDMPSSNGILMVNAIYFAGIWRTTFTNVEWEKFHTSRGQRSVSMMSVIADYNYRKSVSLNCHIVEIPYDGDSASFILVLPLLRGGLPAVLRVIQRKPEWLRAEMLRMESTKLSLSMPKFKIETSLDLSRVLMELGLRTMFDRDQSGLTNIVDSKRLHVSKTIQKAYIEVNELGTIASAASGSMVAISNYEDVKANHPFLFYIKCHSQQLFAGIYNGPNN